MPDLRARTPRVGASAPRQALLRATLPDGREVDVLRVHNARVRGMRLSVTERGIRLTTTPRTSDARALAFVQQHGDWLVGQLEHTFGQTEALAPDVTRMLPLRGEELPVDWVEGRYLDVRRGPHGIVITRPQAVAGAVLGRRLADFYLAEARADVGRWLPAYLPSLPVAPRTITIRPLSSLWGSMDATNRMRLDLALVVAPSRAFEYVLVHELCHLLRRDHSPAFWAEVSARMPGWREQRDYLRMHGRPIKARLRTLCSG